MIEKYKINIHAHTIFSDGQCCPYQMALKAKELGFCCLVTTDHWYSTSDYSMTPETFHVFERSLIEARKILPIIFGLELPVEGEEVLVFGEDAINAIKAEGNGRFDLRMVRILKNTHNCAVILCHPKDPSGGLIEILDGFEAFNNGCYFFRNRGFGALTRFPAWSNSDAHHADHLDSGYNVVDSKITTEDELIEYIKSGKQPCLYVRGKTVSSTGEQ